MLISLQQPSQEQTSAMVYLTQTSTLPGRKGRFLEPKVDPIIKSGTGIHFEPIAESLRALGTECPRISIVCPERWYSSDPIAEF